MSIAEYTAQAAKVRARLFNPPNAIPDCGIDLKRKPPEVKAETTAKLLPLWTCGPLTLMSLVYSEERRKISVGAIKAIVADDYRVNVVDLNSSRRDHDVIEPRHVAMYLAKEMTDHSLPAVGRFFGGRDHTTILSAIRKVKRRAEVDPDFNERIKKIQKLIAARMEVAF